MPKRTDILETLQLTLELLKRIRKDRSLTALELQQKLTDADARFKQELGTIQRLLETLSDPISKLVALNAMKAASPTATAGKRMTNVCHCRA
jgi:hypothetical protein